MFAGKIELKALGSHRLDTTRYRIPTDHLLDHPTHQLGPLDVFDGETFEKLFTKITDGEHA